MTLAEATQRFKDYCKNPENDESRRTALATQHNRIAWETTGEKPIIRVTFGEPFTAGTVFVFREGIVPPLIYQIDSVLAAKLVKLYKKGYETVQFNPMASNTY